MSMTYEDYLNDPRIKNEPMGLKITHAMRFKIQDEIKDMTTEEQIAYFNGSAARLLGKETAERLLVSSK